ncbi:restriction endonuclease [Xanthomonas hortorum]|uniref:restriction endonuclease n=1 Tax=Xanthomonas hortorum TaxID=56454 RepID=UPI003CCF2E92
MPSWILALLAALLLWLAVCAYVWLVRRRADETTEGVRALAAMHWRDFSALVLRVLQDQRGWQPTRLPQDGLPTADFMMQTDHGTRLVACKHGRGYRIGVAAVNELGAMARLAGAGGGVMVTEGRMEREGIAAADKQSIEVLDGTRLWPLLKPYLPGDMETGVVGMARRRAIRHSVIAGVALATLALVAVLALQPALQEAALTQTAIAPTPPVAAPVRAAPSAARYCYVAGSADNGIHSGSHAIRKREGTGCSDHAGLSTRGFQSARTDARSTPRDLDHSGNVGGGPHGRRRRRMAADLPRTGTLPVPAHRARATQPAHRRGRAGALASMHDDLSG